jgi:anti-anti-sigma factor
VARVELSTVDERRGGTPVLSLIGEFDLSNFELVDDMVTLWIAQGRSEAVLDVSRTRFIDASVLRTFATARDAGLSLTIRGADGAVRRALEAGGMSDLLEG